MPSSTFTDRAHSFAENLGDRDVADQIGRDLRQSDFAGPVITFVGAGGRGKSTLFSRAAQITPAPTVGVRFAGEAAWKKTVRDLPFPGSAFWATAPEAAGGDLLCDAPPFGSAESDGVLAALLGLTDLAVMAVQITQPAGAEEVAFAKERLGGISAVLVLTKCDQVDGEEFQEGVEAVLENYGDIPWLAVLLSGLGGNVAGVTSHDQKLMSFEQWWQGRRETHTAAGRRAHLKRLRQGWRDGAREVLEAKEQEYAPRLAEVSQSLAASQSAAEARRLQDELVDGLNSLPERALSFYKSRLSDLRVQVNRVTYRFTSGVRGGAQISQSELERALSRVYQEWDREARLHVRDEIEPFAERLHKAAARYEGLIRAAARAEAAEVVGGADRRQEVCAERMSLQNDVELHGDFDLTISDKLRTAATPTVSALGTGVLFFGVVGATFLWPFAPLIAVVAGGATGLGVFGGMSEANQRRRASELEKAVQRQSVEYELQLQQQLRSEWKQFSESMRDSVAASKRRLTVLLMQQSPPQDGGRAATQESLKRNLMKVDSLRRDLRWLEEQQPDIPAAADTGE